MVAEDRLCQADFIERTKYIGIEVCWSSGYCCTAGNAGRGGQIFLCHHVAGTDRESEQRGCDCENLFHEILLSVKEH
jgi:hypothetical protein